MGFGPPQHTALVGLVISYALSWYSTVGAAAPSTGGIITKPTNIQSVGLLFAIIIAVCWWANIVWVVQNGPKANNNSNVNVKWTDRFGHRQGSGLLFMTLGYIIGWYGLICVTDDPYASGFWSTVRKNQWWGILFTALIGVFTWFWNVLVIQGN